MERVTKHSSQVNIDALLSRAGFRVHRNRAACPFCGPKHRRPGLTVAIHDELWFCHRCKAGGNIRTIAKQQGVTLAPPRIRKTDVPKTQFKKWLAEEMAVLGREECAAYQIREWAWMILLSEPDYAPCWDFLAWFYARQRLWESFWQSASDRVGRYWLYRLYRRRRRHGS